MTNSINNITDKVNAVGTVVNGTINTVAAAQGMETIVGSITLPPGTWIVIGTMWNPVTSPEYNCMLGIGNESIVQPFQCGQIVNIIKPASNTTYYMKYTQWAQESAAVKAGTLLAFRLS